jgi:glycogen operon protein
MLGEFGLRLTGSPDLYEDGGRRPVASINFVTAHDGFSLNDLVSYNEKHNEANGEGNNDGEQHNRSWNCGVEGPTELPEVNRLRARQKRNFLAALFLSQGVPMLLAGDELGRSQGGNNNAYCQDNEVSWLDWEKIDGDLLEFTRRLIRFRREHPVFRRRRWFQGRPIHGSEVSDIAWFIPEGEEMTQRHWDEDFAKSLGVFLNGEGLSGVDEQGNPVSDDTFFVLFNAHYEAVPFTMPPSYWGKGWVKVLDTNEPVPDDHDQRYEPGQQVPVEARSLVVLRHVD